MTYMVPGRYKQLWKSDHNFLCHFSADRHAGFFDVHNDISGNGVDHRHISSHHKTKCFQMLLDFCTAADFFNDILFADFCKYKWHHELICSFWRCCRFVYCICSISMQFSRFDFFMIWCNSSEKSIPGCGFCFPDLSHRSDVSRCVCDRSDAARYAYLCEVVMNQMWGYVHGVMLS